VQNAPDIVQPRFHCVVSASPRPRGLDASYGDVLLWVSAIPGRSQPESYCVVVHYCDLVDTAHGDGSSPWRMVLDL
jgi:hypothetical protein